MDERVVKNVVETIVPAGRYLGIKAKAPKAGVFFCTHPKLDILARRVDAGELVLTAIARPGHNHVRVAAGDELGVVVTYDVRPAKPAAKAEMKPLAEVNSHGKKR